MLNQPNEDMIVALVQEIDRIRADTTLSDEVRAMSVEAVEQIIKKLKTGPRMIVGAAG